LLRLCYSWRMANSAPITVTQAAAQIGVSEQRIRFLCGKLNLGYKLTPSMRLLSAKDVRILVRACVGARTGKNGRPKSRAG